MQKVNWNKNFERTISAFIGRSFEHISRKKLREYYYSAPSESDFERLSYCLSQIGITFVDKNAFQVAHLLTDVEYLLLNENGDAGLITRSNDGFNVVFYGHWLGCK